MISNEKKEVGGWWMWMLLLFVVAIVVMFAVSNVGLFFGTKVERAVFKNSHQYQEAKSQEISIFRAQLNEIDRKLRTPGLDPQTKSNLEAQASAIRVQLESARNR